MNETGRDQVIKYIYFNTEIKAMLTDYILKNNGHQSDVDEVFSDMIYQSIKTLFKKDAIESNGPLNAYIFGVAKHIWIAMLKSRGKTSHYDPDKYDHAEPGYYEQLFLNKERRQVLSKLLEKLRGNCDKVLMLWAGGYTMVEIAAQLGYQSEMMARKKKSHCFKQLLEYLAAHPNLKTELR